MIPLGLMGESVAAGGAAFTLTDLVCEFWIDDASLTDKSGNNRHATFDPAATPGTTTYGTNSVNAFDMDQDRIYSPSLPTTKILTYGTVYNHTGGNTIISAWGADDNTFLPLAADNSTASSTTRVAGSNSNTGRRILSGGELVDNVTDRDDAYDVITNGSLMLITIPAGPVATWIGHGDTNNFRLSGELATAFVISGDLTDAELEKIQGYCAHTYGFALPAGHTYETSPP